MTIGIVTACKDGVVMGADRKITQSRATRMKSLEDKVFAFPFRGGKRDLLVCGSGSSELIRRTIDRINPSGFDSNLKASIYRDIIEGYISGLRRELADRGLVYDAAVLFGMIDSDGKPAIAHITPSALVELKHIGYFTTGIAASYAEMVLRDCYLPNAKIEDAKLIVGGLIQKIGEVDNDVEGMDVFAISRKSKHVSKLTQAERRALTMSLHFSFDLKSQLEQLKKNVKFWKDIEKGSDKAKANDKSKRQKSEGNVKFKKP